MKDLVSEPKSVEISRMMLRGGVLLQQGVGGSEEQYC